jgi:hypothetical protein
MEKKVKTIAVLVGGSLLEGIFFKALFTLTPESLDKHILEAGFLIAGIILDAYLVIRFFR